MVEKNNIKNKTKRGMIWNTIERFSVQIISFIFSTILARILSPNDYGTIGLLTVFINISNVFIDSGFSKALIQKTERTEHDYSTILIFNFVIGVIIYSILFFIAPLIARFYDKPELVNLSRSLFICVILISLTVVQSAILQIQIEFKKIAIINLLSTIFSGVVGVIVACRGGGVWALVIQVLVRQVASTILYWLMTHWFPRTGFSITSFINLFKFGSKLLITGILSSIISSANNLVIGKLYTSEKLGFYTKAEQFPQLISGSMTSILQTTTFPILATYQNSREELISIFRKIINATCLVAFPAMIGLALCSRTIITVILTEKWLFSVQYLFWLSLSYIFTPLQILNLNLLNAIGRSDLNLKLDLFKIPLIILCMVITFPISMKAVVIGRFIFSFIYYLIDCHYVGLIFNFGAFRQLLQSWKAIISTFIMTIGLIAINNLLPTDNIFKLFVMFFFGVVSYMICLSVLKEKEFLRFRSIFFRKLNIIRRKCD